MCINDKYIKTNTTTKKLGLFGVILRNFIFPILMTIAVGALLIILKEILPSTIFFTQYTVGFFAGITYIKAREYYAI